MDRFCVSRGAMSWGVGASRQPTIDIGSEGLKAKIDGFLAAIHRARPDSPRFGAVRACRDETLELAPVPRFPGACSQPFAAATAAPGASPPSHRSRAPGCLTFR